MKTGHNSYESEYNKADELITMRELLMMDIAELKRDLEETKILLKVADQSLHSALYREGELKRQRDDYKEMWESWRIECGQLQNKINALNKERDTIFKEGQSLVRLLESEKKKTYTMRRERDKAREELNKLRHEYNDLIGSDRPPLVKKAEIL